MSQYQNFCLANSLQIPHILERTRQFKRARCGLNDSVADPHFFDPDPDPAFDLDADPDPSFQSDAEPDPDHSVQLTFPPDLDPPML